MECMLFLHLSREVPLIELRLLGSCSKYLDQRFISLLLILKITTVIKQVLELHHNPLSSYGFRN